MIGKAKRARTYLIEPRARHAREQRLWDMAGSTHGRDSHPHRTLALIAVFTAIMGSGMIRLELRTDGAAIYPKKNATVERSRIDRATFKESEQAVLLMTTRSAGTRIDSRSGLEHLKAIHQALTILPGLDPTKHRSVASLLDTQPGAPLYPIPQFLDWLPTDATAFTALVDRLHRFPLTEGLFLSADGSAAAFYLPIATGQSRERFIDALEGWIENQPSPDFELKLTGPVAAEVLLGRKVLRDLAWLVPLMVTVIAILLLLSLRTVGGVLIPLVEVLVVLVWTLGAMGHLGAPVTLMTTILPGLLMTMAVTDEIHLLVRLQSYLARTAPGAGGQARERLRRAIGEAVRDVGRPIVLTSLTTAAGFLSFLSASMTPLRDFGLFAGLGILAAMVLSFTLVPALVVLMPVAWFREFFWRRRSTPVLLPHERFAASNSKRGALLGLALVVMMLPGLSLIYIQDSWIDNFAPASPLVMADHDFNRHFWGSYRYDIVLVSHQVSFLQSAKGLKLMEELRGAARAGPHVGGVTSFILPLERVAEGLDVNAGTVVSALPAKTIRFLMFVVRGLADRIDLAQYVNENATQVRLRLFVRSPSYQRGRELQAYLEREVSRIFNTRDSQVNYHFSGDLPIALEVVDAIVTNQIYSLITAMLGVAILMLITLRNVREAAIASTPLLAALPILYGGMGYVVELIT